MQEHLSVIVIAPDCTTILWYAELTQLMSMNTMTRPDIMPEEATRGLGQAGEFVSFPCNTTNCKLFLSQNTKCSFSGWWLEKSTLFLSAAFSDLFRSTPCWRKWGDIVLSLSVYYLWNNSYICVFLDASPSECSCTMDFKGIFLTSWPSPHRNHTISKTKNKKQHQQKKKTQKSTVKFSKTKPMFQIANPLSSVKIASYHSWQQESWLSAHQWLWVPPTDPASLAVPGSAPWTAAVTHCSADCSKWSTWAAKKISTMLRSCIDNFELLQQLNCNIKLDQ